MPNWVYNNLTLEGHKDLLDEVVEQLNKPFTIKDTTYDKPIISFWNMVKPSDDILEEYHGTANAGSMTNPNNWYSWNNQHWGPKWDIAVGNGEEYAETSISRSDDVVSYNFQTAWSPPIPALVALSNKYPELELWLEYEEEQGWGGEMTIQDGLSLSVSEYNWRCFNCGHKNPNDPNELHCDECEGTVCPECNKNYEDIECEHGEQEEQDDWA
jgi:hypothetical protein